VHLQCMAESCESAGCVCLDRRDSQASDFGHLGGPPPIAMDKDDREPLTLGQLRERDRELGLDPRSCPSGRANTIGVLRRRVLLCPTRYRYPSGFFKPRTFSQCSHAYDNASPAASRPASTPYAETRARRSRGSANPKKDSKDSSSLVTSLALVSCSTTRGESRVRRSRDR